MEGDSVEVGEAGKVAEARVGEELAAGPRCAMLHQCHWYKTPC
jgi:hypothetical protein